MKYLLFISGTMSLVGAMTFALAGVGIASIFVSGIFGTGTWAQTDPVEQFFSVLAITIGKWLTYYNAERPHSTHGLLTPDEAYASKTEPMRIAA